MREFTAETMRAPVKSLAGAVPPGSCSENLPRLMPQHFNIPTPRRSTIQPFDLLTVSQNVGFFFLVPFSDSTRGPQPTIFSGRVMSDRAAFGLA
jgi:hypothetical protein